MTDWAFEEHAIYVLLNRFLQAPYRRNCWQNWHFCYRWNRLRTLAALKRGIKTGKLRSHPQLDIQHGERATTLAQKAAETLP